MSVVTEGLRGDPIPFGSIQVSRVDGGFLCITPPGIPVAAADSDSVAGVVLAWAGAEVTPSEYIGSAVVDADPDEVVFGWDEATVPSGSCFQAAKLRRAGPGAKLMARTAFSLQYHCAAHGTGEHAVVFSRAAVMERLRRWLAYVPKTGSEKILQSGGMLHLQGLSVNASLEIGDPDTFVVRAVREENQPTPTTVSKPTPPQFQIGVGDKAVLHYLSHNLGQDTEGLFLSRVHDEMLEFGPRVEEGDEDGGLGVIPVGMDPSQGGQV